MRLRQVAQVFRRNPTLGEATLWAHLRGDVLGVRFRRQCGIAPYVADFACLSARLIVEVDGPHHDDQRDADFVRQRALEMKGFRFVRVTADDATQRPAEVAERIREALAQPPGRTSVGHS